MIKEQMNDEVKYNAILSFITTLIHQENKEPVFPKLIFDFMKRFTGVVVLWLSVINVSAQSSFMMTQKQFPKVVTAFKQKED